MADTRITPTPPPLRERVSVSDAVLDRLARVSSGSLTTQLFKKGFRQPVLRGLRPLQSPPQALCRPRFHDALHSGA